METGINIFKKSIGMVGDNLDDAVRVSAVIYIVQFVIVTVLLVSVTDSFDMDRLQDPRYVAARSMSGHLTVLLAGVISMLSLAWIAVAWHRFVLLEDYTKGAVPPWSFSRVISYIWKSILLGILLVLIAIIPVTIVVLIGQVSAILSGIGMIAVLAFLIWIVMRLSLVLPATAIDENMSFIYAWEQTDEHSKDIFVAAVLMALLINICGAVLQSILPSNVIGLIVMGAFQWVATMVGLSLATTIYGFCIEGRSVE
ncbi:hypothetical protein BFP76_02720 [Amylibacter kogurei]|uniref:Glycerophosphoryl diester phosphodiesterase membrane domain-containing protein n=1 Tax=Paramylibacter kogurei TaxID=1889778 RepID=A0A2G5K3R3_9RHOB|nr:hypothetical protein [Amylibacter kogurei]PIB24161.1 hypothetical protein BFP76_02720 [Amylibacter kogurei]